MKSFLRGLAVLIGAVGLLAIIYGLALKFFPPTSIKTEFVEVPDETPASDGGMISQEELEAEGLKLAATSRNFGSDCNAAELHTMKTGENTRCVEPGGTEMIYSLGGLPEDPAEQSAEQPIAP